MIVVTGHRGFVGRHLCRALGAGFIGLDVKTGTDILDCALPEASRVFHLAAQTDAQSNDAASDARTNILGTLRLLDRYGARVVFASTSAVNYPVAPYAISKRAAESYARLYGGAVVRFCNLYGEGGHSVIDRFAAENSLVIRGNGEQRRTYAPVQSAVVALLAARPGEMIVLPGKTMSVNEVAAMFPGKPVTHAAASKLDLPEMVQDV